MKRTSRRAFLASTAAMSVGAALREVSSQRGPRGNPFASVLEIADSLRRTPSDQYPLPFTEQEYADRLKRCRQAMSQMKIDLLYVTWPEGMCYLHGYEVTWFRANSTTKWFPLTGTAVHVDRDYLLLAGGEDPVPCAAKERREILEGGTPDDMAKKVIDILRKERWLKSGTVVGLEYWSYVPPRAVSQAIEHAFVATGAKVVDGSMVMRTIRQVKSPAEIAALEHAARIADLGLRAVAQNFKPGMSHCEVCAEYMYAMLKAGGEVPGIAQDVQPGRPHSTHLLPSRRQIQAGEPFAVDLAGVYKRYHANVDRTFIWGDPSRELVRLNQAANGSLEVLARVAKAGTPIAVVNRVLRDYYREKNIWEFHEYCGGYELGIAFPPDWVGEFEWDVVEESPPGVFPGNLVTNYEVNFRIEDSKKYTYPQLALSRDTFVIESHGARKLSAIPTDLIVLG